MPASLVLKVLPPLLIAAALLVSCSGEDDGAAPPGASAAEREPATASARRPEWRRLQMNGQFALVFGERDGRPLAALRCDPQLESLFIDRMMRDSDPRADRMAVRLDDASRRLPIIWSASSPPTASSMLALEDGLTDGLTRLSGTIEITLGKDILALPTDRRIGTLVEECRQAQLE